MDCRKEHQGFKTCLKHSGTSQKRQDPSQNGLACTHVSCLAIVQRAFIRGCKLDEIPVIIGQGAEGKSAFVKFLLPAHIRALGFTENIAPNADSKTFGEQIIGRWVAEFSELINVSGGNLARIKANITATDDGTTCLCSDNRVQPAHMCAVWHRK